LWINLLRPVTIENVMPADRENELIPHVMSIDIRLLPSRSSSQDETLLDRDVAIAELQPWMETGSKDSTLMSHGHASWKSGSAQNPLCDCQNSH
jgi:hypothetical protein